MSQWQRFGTTKRMKFGTNVRQREIVSIPFPYSDIFVNKKRPVLIISNKRYHENNKDIICCAITSSEKFIYGGISIDNKDLEEGRLKVKSTVKPGKIYSLHQNRIVRKIERLTIEKTKEVIMNLNLDVEIDGD